MLGSPGYFLFSSSPLNLLFGMSGGWIKCQALFTKRWMALSDASPCIGISPSLWQAASVGAITSSQSRTELTHRGFRLYKAWITSGFPSSRVVAPRGPNCPSGVFTGGRLFGEFWTQFYTLPNHGTAEKSVETFNCRLHRPAQLRYGQRPRGRKPPNVGLASVCIPSSWDLDFSNIDWFVSLTPSFVSPASWVFWGTHVFSAPYWVFCLRNDVLSPRAVSHTANSLREQSRTRLLDSPQWASSLSRVFHPHVLDTKGGLWCRQAEFFLLLSRFLFFSVNKLFHHGHSWKWKWPTRHFSVYFLKINMQVWL